MSKRDKDEMGSRMKKYEGQEAGRRFSPLLPLVVRLDGKGFSKFTKGLARPYDKRLSDLMVDTEFFKWGTLIRRCKVQRAFSPGELEALPAQHNARRDPSMLFERTEMQVLPVCFNEVVPREGYLLGGPWAVRAAS